MVGGKGVTRESAGSKLGMRGKDVRVTYEIFSTYSTEVDSYPGEPWAVERCFVKQVCEVPCSEPEFECNIRPGI